MSFFLSAKRAGPNFPFRIRDTKNPRKPDPKDPMREVGFEPVEFVNANPAMFTNDVDVQLVDEHGNPVILVPKPMAVANPAQQKPVVAAAPPAPPPASTQAKK